MIIDAHQHLWDPHRARYDWLHGEDPSLQRTIGTTEILPALRHHHVDATVLVQSADNHEDTEVMLDAATVRPDVVAVVAYAPLDQPEEVALRIDEYLQHPLVVGIRNLIHNIPDPDWILRPRVAESLSLLEDAGLTFDLVSVLPRHLQHVAALSDRHPGLRIVIDHLSKPPIGSGDRRIWWDLIARAAENPLVFAKVSGLYATDGGHRAASATQIQPFLDHALDIFGARRLMFGSDWPICLPMGGYDQVCAALFEAFGTWGAADRDEVLSGTAARFYGIAQAGELS